MRNQSSLFVATLLAAVLTTTVSASVPVVTVPPDINPGTQYRLAFVTSTVRNATSSDIADYNAFVTGVANTQPALAGLGTTWAAIASTATVDARDNTNTNPVSATGVPIFLLDGTLLANTNADLWDGNIDAPLNVTEEGTLQPNTSVWTGTRLDGIESDSTRGLGRSGDPQYGSTGTQSTGWVGQGFDLRLSSYPLYALSGVFSTPPLLPLEGRLPATPGGTDYQAYYDPNLDITWANVYSSGLPRNWADANAWAESLRINGVTGWRLPSVDVNGDHLVAFCNVDLGCADNEMDFLASVEDITGDAPGPFSFVFSAGYWSSGTDATVPTAWAVEFAPDAGQTRPFVQEKSATLYAWAVYPGDVGTPPHPATAVISITNGLLLDDEPAP